MISSSPLHPVPVQSPAYFEQLGAELPAALAAVTPPVVGPPSRAKKAETAKCPGVGILTLTPRAWTACGLSLAAYTAAAFTASLIQRLELSPLL